MIKKAILSFVRRLSGAERNFQKMVEIENQLRELRFEIILNQQKGDGRESAFWEKVKKHISDGIAHTEWHSNRNYDAIKDVLYSMISLASTSKDASLFLPGGTQHVYGVEKNASGRIHFSSTEGNGKPPVFLVTLPKSGTYFLGKILEELGYANPQIHAGPDAFHDYRNHSLKEQMDSYLDFAVSLPYSLQIQLTQKGQLLLGHLPFEYAPLLREQTLFLTIRDLRYVFVSALKFLQRREFYKDRSWFSKGTSEEALFLFISDERAMQFIRSGEQMLEWCKFRPESVIRYEYIIDDKHKYFEPTFKRIANILSLPYSDLLLARERALGQQTHSYSGQPSRLMGIWSERIEEKFQEIGGHVINTSLGYPGNWQDFCEERERERERERETRA